jgi:hypothetical protein
LTVEARITRLELATGANRPPTVYELRCKALDEIVERHWPALIAAMDPEDIERLAEVDPEGPEWERWGGILQSTCLDYEREGRPLALPHECFEELWSHPEAVLGQHECDACGLKIPCEWRNTGNGYDRNGYRLLDACPLCGGAVTHEMWTVRRLHNGGNDRGKTEKPETRKP